MTTEPREDADPQPLRSITRLTEFGLRDPYVARLKGAIASTTRRQSRWT